MISRIIFTFLVLTLLTTATMAQRTGVRLSRLEEAPTVGATIIAGTDTFAVWTDSLLYRSGFLIVNGDTVATQDYLNQVLVIDSTRFILPDTLAYFQDGVRIGFDIIPDETGIVDSTRLQQDSILVYFQDGAEIGRDTLSLATPETDPIYAADSASIARLSEIDSTRLSQDSILVYYQNGIEIGRDTIIVTGGGGGGSSLWTQTGSDIYYNTGKVGIGINSTDFGDASLQVGGVSIGANTPAGSAMFARFKSGTSYRAGGIFSYYNSSYAKDQLVLSVSNNTTPIAYSKGVLFLDQSGNVGIGDNTPDYKLSANGTIQGNAFKYASGTSGFIPVSDATGLMTLTNTNSVLSWADQGSYLSSNEDTVLVGASSISRLEGVINAKGTTSGDTESGSLALIRVGGAANPRGGGVFSYFNSSIGQDQIVLSVIGQSNEGKMIDYAKGVIFLNENGNTGIGQNNPQYKLDVTGGIRTTSTNYFESLAAGSISDNIMLSDPLTGELKEQTISSLGLDNSGLTLQNVTDNDSTSTNGVEVSNIIVPGKFRTYYGTKNAIRGGYDNNNYYSPDSVGQYSVSFSADGGAFNIYSGSLSGGLNVVKANGSVIAGGFNNQIDAPTGNNSILGGARNIINAGPGNLIAGGEDNIVGSSAGWTTITGGRYNYIDSAPQYGAIVNGFRDTLLTGDGSVILGGQYNYVNTAYSVVGGQYNRSTASSQAIFGKYNDTTSVAQFQVGNGTGLGSNRSNAFEVFSTGVFRSGNYTFNADQDTTGLNGYVQAYNESTGEIELTNPQTIAGSNTEAARNYSATTSGAGSIVISHSLGVIPSVTVTNASATPYVFAISSVTTTNFTIFVYDMSGTALASTAINFDYQLIIP